MLLNSSPSEPGRRSLLDVLYLLLFRPITDL